ncbi:MAG: hypothetical protein LKJ75_06895 [Clostridia bacterium]|jgi:hypothetical protein|nr:hypothetical protein [Clostridia bacterium]MCI2014911.1 hypothetical protein [Clostridia bacterium]
MKKIKNTSLKRTLNLAVKEKNKGNDPKVLLPAAIITAVLIAAFCKFAVIDRLNAANDVYSEINYLNQQAEMLHKENEQYDNVKDNYEHYTYSFYNDDELALVDIDDLFTTIDREIMPKAQIKSFVFESNVLNTVIDNLTLKDVSLIVSDLYKSPIVDTVTVSTATTNNGQKLSQGQNVTATITVTLKSKYSGGDKQ